MNTNGNSHARNPTGIKYKRDTRAGWIDDEERIREGRETWKRLLRIRDDLVVERKELRDDKGLIRDPITHEPIMVDVVMDSKAYLKACELILNRAFGLPKQELELNSDGGGIQINFIRFNDTVQLQTAPLPNPVLEIDGKREEEGD